MATIAQGQGRRPRRLHLRRSDVLVFSCVGAVVAIVVTLALIDSALRPPPSNYTPPSDAFADGPGSSPAVESLSRTDSLALEIPQVDTEVDTPEGSGTSSTSASATIQSQPHRRWSSSHLLP